MADDEKDNKKRPKTPKTPRSSARSASKRKLNEMAQAQLLMSGLKTEKEKLLAQHLSAQYLQFKKI